MPTFFPVKDKKRDIVISFSKEKENKMNDLISKFFNEIRTVSATNKFYDWNAATIESRKLIWDLYNESEKDDYNYSKTNDDVLILTPLYDMVVDNVLDSDLESYLLICDKSYDLMLSITKLLLNMNEAYMT